MDPKIGYESTFMFDHHLGVNPKIVVKNPKMDDWKSGSKPY